MKILLLLLVVFQITNALNVPPNSQMIYYGYDVRQMQTRSYTGSAQFTIFRPTFGFGKSWDSAAYKKQFSIPDQVECMDVIEKDISMKTRVENSVHEAMSFVESKFNFGFGIQYEGVGIEANYSQVEGHIHQTYSQDFVYTMQGYIENTVYVIVMGPYALFRLDPWFEKMLNDVPSCPRTPKDLSAVESIIKFYGNVFAKKLYMGGRWNEFCKLEKHIYNQTSEDWCIKQFGFKFSYDGFDIGAGGGSKNETEKMIDKAFLGATASKQFFMGGNPQFQKNTTLDKWYDSIQDYPVIVAADFLPWSELVTGEDYIKKTAITELIEQHVKTGKISQPPACAFSLKTSDQKQEEELSIITGFQFIGLGYNNKKLSPQSRVLKLETKNPTKYQNPFYPDYKFAIPDVVLLKENTESMERNDTRVCTTRTEYQNTISSSKREGNFFGHESEYMYRYDYFYNYENQAVFWHEKSIQWYELKLRPLEYLAPKLSDYAQLLLNLFSRNMDIANPKLRRLVAHFFDSFGDSVITGVRMGGKMTFKSLMDKKVAKYEHISEYHSESKNTYFGVFSDNESYDYYSRNVGEEFAMHAKMELKLHGGDHKLVTLNTTKDSFGYYTFNWKDLHAPVLNWEKYTKSIKDYLVPIYYETVPIETFIQDEKIRSIISKMRMLYVDNKL